MLRELKACVDNCHIVGAKLCVVHLSSGEQAPGVTELGQARFSRFVEYAAANGIRIAFENQRKMANLAWALETFDASIAGLCWDCGHESCFTPGKHYMPLFGDRILCTHIHDNLGNYNEDLHLLPFDGKIDFSRVVHQLQERNYGGSLMLEVVAAVSGRYEDLSVEAYLQRAADAANALRRMVDGA